MICYLCCKNIKILSKTSIPLIPPYYHVFCMRKKLKMRRFRMYSRGKQYILGYSAFDKKPKFSI
jgi:hypothetical protein